MTDEAQTILNASGEPVRSGTRDASSRAVAELRALRDAVAANDLKRDRFARLAGLQYDEQRDVWEVAGYPDDYTFQEGFSRYQRQHVAGRIVDMPAQTTWRNEPEVREEGSDPEEETEFEEAWRSLVQRLSLYHAWERLDRMAGIGEFAVQLVGTTDVQNTKQLAEPLEEGALDDPTDVAYVSQFKQSEVEIAEWVTDPGSPNFGMPKTYRIDLSGDVEGFDVGTQRVHRSRVLHVAESPLDDRVYGRPRLQRVLNLLHDLEKVTAATGEAYWQLASRILQASVSPDVSQESFRENKEDLEDDLDDIVHDLKRHFLGQGIELEYLGGETPDPSDPVAMLQTLVAAAAGIPQRILFGSERGELASTQDTREWLGRISERQTRFAEPQVVRAFVDRLQAAGALPDVEYVVEWPNLFEHSEKERAEIEQIRAKTVKTLADAFFQGGDRAVRLAASLIPEVEEILEEDVAAMREFVRETAEMEEGELAAAGNGDGPSDLEVPSFIRRGT